MHQPAPDSLMLAPCYCGGFNPMWFLNLCPFLEPRTPPLATRPPPQPGSSVPSKEGMDWAAGPEMDPHKELLSAIATSGDSQQPAWQPAHFQETVFFPRVVPGCLLLSQSSFGSCGPSPSGLCSWLFVGSP